ERRRRVSGRWDELGALGRGGGLRRAHLVGPDRSELHVITIPPDTKLALGAGPHVILLQRDRRQDVTRRALYTSERTRAPALRCLPNRRQGEPGGNRIRRRRGRGVP